MKGVRAQSWDILLIDDEAVILLAISNFLKQHEYSVLTAQRSWEALKQLEENKVGLILLDVNLSGEEGVSLMPLIRQNHPGIPIILYTGMPEEDKNLQTLLGKGANGYVNKAQPPEDLLLAIEKVQNENSGLP
jgi:DNA-binding response OmpR family regulator